MSSSEVKINIITDIISSVKPTAFYKECETKSPLRIGFGVNDMTTFGLGKAGGGGCGGVVELYSYTTCQLTFNENGVDQLSMIKSNKKHLLAHLIEVFKAHFPNFPKNAHFHLSTRCDTGSKTHIGLGSSSSAAMSTLFAMNEMFEPQPFSREDLRKMWVLNYCEEEKDGRLCLGYQAGMTACGAMHGGIFVLETDALTYKSYKFTNPNLKVYACFPNENRIEGTDDIYNPISNMDQEKELLDEATKHDHDDAVKQAKNQAYNDMKGLLEKQELKKFGDLLWGLNFQGSRRIEIEKEGRNLMKFMQYCHNEGFEVVSMSSIGPTVVVLTETKTVEDLKEALELYNFEMMFETKIDNKGCQVVKKSK